MSQFYGWLQGHRGETTRCGSKGSGIHAKVQSWDNQCIVEINEYDGKDVITVDVATKNGEDGVRVVVNGKELFLHNRKLLTKEEAMMDEL